MFTLEESKEVYKCTRSKEVFVAINSILKRENIATSAPGAGATFVSALTSVLLITDEGSRTAVNFKLHMCTF